MHLNVDKNSPIRINAVAHLNLFFSADALSALLSRRRTLKQYFFGFRTAGAKLNVPLTAERLTEV